MESYGERGHGSASGRTGFTRYKDKVGESLNHSFFSDVIFLIG